MDYKKHRINVASKNLQLAELENFEWPEIARMRVHLCIKCERFLYILETNELSDDETDIMFELLGEEIFEEMDTLPDRKEELPVDIEDMSCECRKALRHNIKCYNYAIEKTRLMVLITKVFNGTDDRIISNRYWSNLRVAKAIIKSMQGKEMAAIFKNNEEDYFNEFEKLRKIYEVWMSESETDKTARKVIASSKTKILKELWLNAKEEAIRIYGKKEYEHKYCIAIKQELNALSKYSNGPELIYTLMQIHHGVMRKMGSYSNAKKDYMLNGCSAYVGGILGQSIILFLLGLTGYDRLRENRRSPFDGTRWVFDTTMTRESNEKDRPLYITIVVSDDYCKVLKDLLIFDSSWMNQDDQHTVSKYINGFEKRCIIYNTIDSDELLRREKTYINPDKLKNFYPDRFRVNLSDENKHACEELFNENGEYWIGENIILYRDKSLNFLSELEKNIEIPLKEIGYPNWEDIVVPMDFNSPNEISSKPIKWMFREDVYLMLRVNTKISDKEIQYLIDQLRRNKEIDVKFHEQINAAGMKDEEIKLLSKIGYFPLKGGLINADLTTWRIEQFRKKEPIRYYRVLYKLFVEGRL